MGKQEEIIKKIEDLELDYYVNHKDIVKSLGSKEFIEYVKTEVEEIEKYRNKDWYNSIIDDDYIHIRNLVETHKRIEEQRNTERLSKGITFRRTNGYISYEDELWKDRIPGIISFSLNPDSNGGKLYIRDNDGNLISLSCNKDDSDFKY